MRFFPIYACAYAAGGHKKSGFICCCPRVEVPITLHTPQALSAVLPPDIAITSFVVYEKRAVTPYNTCQRRPRTRKNVLFCLVATCFSPGRTQMKPWFGRNVAQKPGYQAHISALDARCARLLCVPMASSGRHAVREWQKNGLVTVVPLLSLPAIAVRRDDNASPLRSKQTGVVGFSASL